MKAHEKISALQSKLKSRGIEIDYGYVYKLRLAEMRLHRWCELECGDGDAYKSWAIERDETTNQPFMCIYPNSGKNWRYRIADREAGALRTVRKICEELGLRWYYQTDPRGCALYISKEGLNETNYSSRGYAVCDDSN